MEKAKYAAMRERSVGLGVMGFHSFLQEQNVPFESVMAKVWNIKMFKHIRAGADAASQKLAAERGPCPDAAEYGIMERFSHKIADRADRLDLDHHRRHLARHRADRGQRLPAEDPVRQLPVRNRQLQKLLARTGRTTRKPGPRSPPTKGGVQHLDFLTEHEKDVFKTAFELDQRWMIEHAADRTPFICQSQSLNIFMPANVNKRDLHQIHYQAWKKGVKSLYYCRSLSIQRADNVVRKSRPAG